MDIGKLWAIGVDLGGTKIEVARVDEQGNLGERTRRPTESQRGPAAVKDEIVAAVRELWNRSGSSPAGIGIGVAGQVDAQSDVVRFAPNLGWRDEPLGADLRRALGLPVVVTNDVRAATWGEWLHGAGQGCRDLVCIFVGTGIGGGIVSGGQILAGCSNTAGEVGHIVIDYHGPACHCGNRGCLEALAGGWAIARRAQEMMAADPTGWAALMKRAGSRNGPVTAMIVEQAAQEGNPMAQRLMEEVEEALIAGAVSLIHAFNPCRLILGGGVIDGMPKLIDGISQGLRKRALTAASATLEILRARLEKDAGVVGAASLVLRSISATERPEK